MRFAKGLACLLVFAAALSTNARSHAQGFEDLVEDVLKRHQGAGGQQPAQPPPTVAPTSPSPSASPPSQAGAPVLAPVEPGPRPYTPPKIAPATGEAPPAPAAKVFPAPTAPTPDAPLPAAKVTPSPDGAATVEASPTVQGAPRTRESLTVEEVNSAVFPETLEPFNGASPLVLKAQILLDRAGASPGAIDAYSGGNLQKAVSAVETVLGLPADGVLDKQVWDALAGDSAPPVVVQYAITPEDLAYSFLPSIPDDYAEQAKLPNLDYTSPEEMFGERFHMDIKLLKALNPTADFRTAGTPIFVAAVESAPITTKVARIVADKALRQVRAYDAGNRLLVAYPATIGSEENPSPTGDHLIASVAPKPVYYYSPANFVQAGNTEKLELPPGPNNPVGTVWIDLTEPTYGIHGTPDPAKIDKTGSHGCVRLTNWDAEELAGLVAPGVVVSFQ